MVHARFSQVLATLVCAVLLCRAPMVAGADMIPASADATVVMDTTAATVPETSESARDQVAAQLAAIGMSAEQVQARLAEMSAADVRAFAASPGQVQFAGGLEEKWYFIIIAGLIVVGMLILTVIINNKDKDDDTAPTPTPEPPLLPL